MADSLENEKTTAPDPTGSLKNESYTIQIETPFLDSQEEPLTLPLKKTVFDRLTQYMEKKNLQPKTVGKVVIFTAALGTAGAVTRHLLVERKKKKEEEASPPPVLTLLQEKKYLEAYEQEYSRIFTYLSMKGAPEKDAKDLTDDTYTNFRKGFPTYTFNYEKSHPYLPLLIKIAHNLHANWVRDRIRHPETSLFSMENYRQRRDLPKGDLRPVETQVEKTEEEIEIKKKLGQALMVLIPRYQEIIVLKSLFTELDEKSANKVIAWILGTTVGAVKSRYHRALDSLAKKIEKLE